MKTYKYKLINILLVISLATTIFIWWHFRSELSKAKDVMKGVKAIELKEVDVKIDTDLSNILDMLMDRTDLKVVDIVLSQEGGEVFIQCDNSLKLVASLLGELGTKVKNAYIRELKLNTEKCEFTLVFVK